MTKTLDDSEIREMCVDMEINEMCREYISNKQNAIEKYNNNNKFLKLKKRLNELGY